MAITEISVSKIYILATEPTNKVKDRFWFDTTNNLLKRYDGTSWKPISVSSDDVVVLSSGNKISLTNYLNTQIAALAEGIDSKQDKLEHYTETVNSYGTKKSTIDNESFGVYTNAGIELNSDGIITLKGSQIELTGDINGPAISTSIPASESAVDTKVPSEKAVATAISGKADKATTLAGYNIGDAYTKTEVDTELGKKQDKLETYVEEVTEYNSKATIGAYEVVTNGAYVSITGGDAVTIDGGSVTINSSSDVVINGAVSGTAISTSIPASINAASDTKLASEKAIATAIDTKQNNLVYYHENVSANQTALINGAKSFVIEGTVKGLVINSGYGGITIDSNDFSEGEAVISIANNSWMNHSDPILFDIDGDTIKISDALLIPEIKNKQNSTDNSLNTTDKTIVGAINEIKSLVIGNTLPTPITDVKTITTTLENLITDTQYANKPGTILINPAITNIGVILVGEGITDINKAFPIYTDQPVTISFKNINDFKVAGNIAGDKFNYIISFGYINTNIVSNNLKITTTNGIYEITPEGDAEYATLKISKIS